MKNRYFETSIGHACGTGPYGYQFLGLHLAVSAVVIFYILAGHVVAKLWGRQDNLVFIERASWFYQDRFFEDLSTSCSSADDVSSSIVARGQIYFSGREPIAMGMAIKCVDRAFESLHVHRRQRFHAGPPGMVIRCRDTVLYAIAILTDRVRGSGVTEPTEGAPRAKEDGHRRSWLLLSLRRPNTHQRNHDDQAHYRIDRVG